MIEIFNGSVYNFGTQTAIKAIIKYEKQRIGADMQYRFYYKIYLGGTYGSSAYYQNNVRGTFTLNNEVVWTKNTKSSNKGWSYEYTSEWFTIEDKTDGKVPFKFTIKDTANSSWCNYSSTTYQLEIDPAGSGFKTLSNFNIGQPFTITINKYNEEFYDKLAIKLGDTLLKTLDNIETTVLVDFSTNELDVIYGLTTDVQNADFTFEISSYEDEEMSIQIGATNTKVVKGYIIASNPLISSKSAIDTNDTTTALTGDNTRLIRLYSNVKVSVNAVGQNKATIKSITINNEAATNGEITFNKINTNVFNIVVTDSRGFQTTDSITLEMINYIELTLNASVSRNQPTDNSVEISYSGNCFKGNFGATENTLKVQYRFKEKGETFNDTDIWYDMTPTVYEDNTYEEYSFIAEGVDYQKLYEFQVRVVDELMINQVIGIIVRKGKPIINWGEDFLNVNGDIKQNNININEIYTNFEYVDRKQVVLWTNPNPDASFGTQTITFETDDYDIGIIIFRASETDELCNSGVFMKGTGTKLLDFSVPTSSSYASLMKSRNVNYVSDTSLEFEECLTKRSNTTSGYTENNNYNVPLKIIGFKL